MKLFMHIFKNSVACLALTIACTLIPKPAAAELAPGWRALPDSTIFAVRMPQTRDFIEQLQETTNLGQTILTPQRYEAAMDLIKQEAGADYEEFIAELEEYGFSQEDLMEAAKCNWGLAMVAEPRGEGQDERIVSLMWADLGEELIDKLYTAHDRFLEDTADEEHAPRRIDSELNGMDVRIVTYPQLDWESEMDWSVPDNFHEMSEEQQNQHFEEQEKKNDAIEMAVVDQTHVIYTRSEGRLLIAIGTPQAKDEVQALIAEDKPVDLDAVTDIETVEAVAARFFGGQSEGVENSFAAAMQANAKLAQITPDAGGLIEFYLDTPAIRKMVDASMQREDPDNFAMYQQVMTMLGLDNVGVVAGSVAMDAQALRYQVWADAPQPRTGLVKTLTEVELSPTPPAWVPVDMSFAQFGYDLGSLWDLVVEMTQQIGGDEAAMQLGMADGMLQGFIEADVRTLLTSLGTRHSIVTLPPKEVMTTDWQYNEETEQYDEVEVPTMMQPVGFVWEVSDAELWQRVMTALTNLTAGQGDQIQSVQEQGFTGLRSDQDVPMSLMTGQGKLVLGVGPGVTERLLSLMNNPPEGDHALANADIYQQANRYLDLKPGLMTQYQDGGQAFADSLTTVLQAMRASGETDEALQQQIENIFPTEEELKAAVGVTAGQAYFNDAGLLIEMVMELPAD
jgi:hypothetical protein